MLRVKALNIITGEETGNQDIERQVIEEDIVKAMNRLTEIPGKGDK